MFLLDNLTRPKAATMKEEQTLGGRDAVVERTWMYLQRVCVFFWVAACAIHRDS